MIFLQNAKAITSGNFNISRRYYQGYTRNGVKAKFAKLCAEYATRRLSLHYSRLSLRNAQRNRLNNKKGIVAMNDLRDLRLVSTKVKR